MRSIEGEDFVSEWWLNDESLFPAFLILKERDRFVNQIIPFLIQFVSKTLSREEAESSTKYPSLKRCIKNGLMSIIKRKPNVISWTDELSDTMSKLGMMSKLTCDFY